uniref:Uncharacterized protein n=1 Tax=Rhizophora mucronata TaxID=61149 RepID=A0A2P2NRB6_RHIMU
MPMHLNFEGLMRIISLLVITIMLI